MNTSNQQQILEALRLKLFQAERRYQEASATYGCGSRKSNTAYNRVMEAQAAYAKAQMSA